jgi:hypothetical protein
MSASVSPRIFRILIPAIDLSASRRFFEELLATPGREVAPGRVYFDCGSVILGILDYSSVPERERPKPTEAIYLSTDRLSEVHERALRLGCLSKETIHGDPENPMGEIVVRPWGERSFYVHDLSGNALCFVDDQTLFTGSAEQVGRLRKETPE